MTKETKIGFLCMMLYWAWVIFLLLYTAALSANSGPNWGYVIVMFFTEFPIITAVIALVHKITGVFLYDNRDNISMVLPMVLGFIANSCVCYLIGYGITRLLRRMKNPVDDVIELK